MVQSSNEAVGTPVVWSATASGSLNITFYPTCADGTLPVQGPKPGCTPAIVAYIVYAVPTFAQGADPVVVDADSVTCNYPNETLPLGVCPLPLGINLQLYVYYNISVQVEYAGDNKIISVSDFGFFAYLITRTPDSNVSSIQKQYGMPNYYTGNYIQDIPGWESYSPTDLQQYLQLNKVSAPVVTIFGSNDPSSPGTEGSLDIQLIAGLGTSTRIWFFLMAEDSGFLPWATNMNAYSNTYLPSVHSLSYSIAEVEDGVADYVTYSRADNEFIKLGLRGRTILVSSGDGGASYVGSGEDRVGSCSQGLANWPASSPYVTSVGGTTLSTYSDPKCFDDGLDCRNNSVVEIAASIQTGCTITSGGGFSALYPRPSYQNNQVSQYLSTLSTPVPAGFANTANRGHPDVSVLAHGFPIFYKGSLIYEDGTSGSAPIVASMIRYLNQARWLKGNPELGFLNPLFYQLQHDHPEIFNDVTVGNNACGRLNDGCCPYGFPAAPGWDPVTGLGTINFPALAAVINTYPATPPQSTSSGIFPAVVTAVAASSSASASNVATSTASTSNAATTSTSATASASTTNAASTTSTVSTTAAVSTSSVSSTSFTSFASSIGSVSASSFAASTTTVATTTSAASTSVASTSSASTAVVSTSVASSTSATSFQHSSTTSTTSPLVNAPTIVSATFSVSGVSVSVAFSGPTQRASPGEMFFSCAFVLDVNSNGLLGSGASCSFPDPATLLIALDATAVLVPGVSLTILPDSLFAQGGSVYSVSGSVTVAPPANAPVPVVSISGPTLVGSCDTFTLTGTASGSGGRPFPSIAWSVTAAPGSPAPPAALLTLLAAASGLSLTLDPTLVPPSTQFVFTLQAGNFFGMLGSQSLTVTRSNLNLPTVSIAGPSTVTVPAGQDITFSGSAVVPSCLVAPTFLYSWTAVPPLPVGTTNRLTLQVPAYTFTAGVSYTLTLTAFVSSNNLLNNSAQVKVTVPHGALVASIIGGNTRTIGVGRGGNLMLDGSPSLDPDSNTASLDYSWTCTFDNRSACADNTGAALSFTSASVQSFPAAGLSANLYYNFVLQISSADGRTASSSSSVFVVAGRPPTVVIQPLPTLQVSASAALNLSALPAPTGGSYAWTETTGYLNMGNPVNFDSPIAGKYLVIHPGALVPGRTYQFQFSAIQKVGTGSASLQVTVANPPYAGSCSVSPTTGTALQTSFAFSCANWQDDSGHALTYTFSYTNINNVIVVGNAVLSGSVTAVLPESVYGSWPITATVTNIYGASTSVSLSAVVKASTASVADALALAQSSLLGASSALQQFGNANAAISSFVAMASVLSSATSTSSEGLTSQAASQVTTLQQNIFAAFSAIAPAQPTAAEASAYAGTIAVLAQGASAWSQSNKNALVSLVKTYAAASPSKDALGSLPITLSHLLTPAFPPFTKGSASQEHTQEDQNDQPLLLQQPETAPFSVTATSGSEDDFNATILSAIDGIAVAALNTLVCGQTPLLLDSNNFTIFVAKTPIGDSESVNQTFSVGNITFLLPLNETLLGGSFDVSEIDCLSTVIVVAPAALYPPSSADFVSDIVAISLFTDGGVELNVTGLSSPVTIIIPVDAGSSGVCEFYDSTSDSWSQDNCTTVSSNSTVVICECNHLTEFAIVSPPPSSNNQAVIVGTTVGLLVGLPIVLLACFLAYRLWWKPRYAAVPPGASVEMPVRPAP